MLRQIFASLTSYGGVLLTFVFWYTIIPLQPKFEEWQRDPMNLFLALAVWGLLGGISCLFLSRHIAAWGMKVDLAETNAEDADITKATLILHRVQKKLGLKHKPQLGVYENSEINGFMVGLTLSRSTLALSRGALQNLSDDDLAILMSREILHFKSGDVHALAFMQGVLFSFTLYVSRMLAFLLGTSLRQTEEEETSSQGVEMILTTALLLLLTLPGTLIFWLFSRASAVRADTAVARLVGSSVYAAFLNRVQGLRPPKSEIFSDAFKLQSQTYPAWSGWPSLQPGLPLRQKILVTPS
ncbi:MAG TPA: M48 family metalloprotease [Oligoflexus sp.]|uniref:M48 family metalloprotease n=1 Tax=Oligoflexus sp. TaxID=1971216 RepID=UPI002D803563|nr:M48 family metalloprotease [Oligoflexus sp.]HET9238760.1 M48 family metalloprotease [Oligoflexus sp.]